MPDFVAKHRRLANSWIGETAPPAERRHGPSKATWLALSREAVANFKRRNAAFRNMPCMLTPQPFDVWLLMKREEEIATEYGHKVESWEVQYERKTYYQRTGFGSVERGSSCCWAFRPRRVRSSMTRTRRIEDAGGLSPRKQVCDAIPQSENGGDFPELRDDRFTVRLLGLEPLNLQAKVAFASTAATATVLPLFQLLLLVAEPDWFEDDVFFCKAGVVAVLSVCAAAHAELARGGEEDPREALGGGFRLHLRLEPLRRFPQEFDRPPFLRSLRCYASRCSWKSLSLIPRDRSLSSASKLATLHRESFARRPTCKPRPPIPSLRAKRSTIRQGTGSWETSTFSPKLLLVCELKGMGNYCRPVAQDVYPWTAYANSDGFLVAEAPTPISLN
eukprot:s1521_g2.t1